MKIDCFKAYDVRGRVPEELNENIAYRIGLAYAYFVQPVRVVVGRDIRLSSQALSDALIRGLRESGVDVFDLGLCGTEVVYFATFHMKMDGGIMITASHNPSDYNGIKFVRQDSRPISADSGLETIRILAERNASVQSVRTGQLTPLNITADYIRHLLTYVDQAVLKPLKIVVNAGNGSAGLVVDELESHVPFRFVKINHTPDGTFPNGVPNPQLSENHALTASVIRESGANLGIAWDGDYDRCVFFDELGNYVDGYYIVGLLAKAFLDRSSSEKIVHDPRLTWNTLQIVNSLGGEPVLCRPGHSFIKAKMREVNAIYGGEASGHHYFRNFSYCDSGMVPWLLIAEMLGSSNRKLSEMLIQPITNFPTSGEISLVLDGNPKNILTKMHEAYNIQANRIDRIDGLSMEFDNWRFNLRIGNTESFVRLNVESRGDTQLLEQKTKEVLSKLARNGQTIR